MVSKMFVYPENREHAAVVEELAKELQRVKQLP